MTWTFTRSAGNEAMRDSKFVRLKRVGPPVTEVQSGMSRLHDDTTLNYRNEHDESELPLLANMSSSKGHGRKHISCPTIGTKVIGE